MLKTLLKRIEVAVRAAVGRLKFAEDCICFSAKEPPVFFSDEEQETAYQVKCPLHGDRFQKHYYLFRAPWFKERMAKAWNGRDAQYKKAWLASGLPAPEWDGTGRRWDQGADVCNPISETARAVSARN
jgi:hypothetical protein